MPATARHGAAPATHTTSKTTANVSYRLWQHCCWRDTRAGALLSRAFVKSHASNTVTTSPSFCRMCPWVYAAAVDVNTCCRVVCSNSTSLLDLYLCSVLSPYSSGERGLLPVLHSHLGLQQPGQQHTALLRPAGRSHQPPRLDRQEEEQEEGPQELTYDTPPVSNFSLTFECQSEQIFQGTYFLISMFQYMVLLSLLLYLLSFATEFAW